MPRQPFFSIIPYLESAGPGRKLLSLLFFILGAGIIFTLIGALVGQALYGIPTEFLANPGLAPKDTNDFSFMKVVQGFSSVGLFIIPPFLLAIFSRGNVGAQLRINKSPGFLLVILSMILMIAQIPLINASAEWNNQLVFPDFLKEVGNWMRIKEDEAKVITEGFLDMPDIRSLIIALVLIAVIPAIGEELLFRSSIQPLLIKWTGRPHLAIWLTAFIFSFIHFQFFGFIPRFFIGAFLGYLMHWSGNAWTSIAAHFANNATQVIGYYFIQHNLTDATTDEFGKGNNLVSQLLVSLALTIAGLYFFYVKCRRSPKMPQNDSVAGFPH